jgi:hypothetical protein
MEPAIADEHTGDAKDDEAEDIERNHKVGYRHPKISKM